MQIIVRPPGPAFRDALSEHPEKHRIDPDRAVRQHEAFVAALEAAGLPVLRLPPDPALPDATFVSDTLVALAPAAAGRGSEPRDSAATAMLAVARPASPSRRPEVASVVAAARRCAGGAREIVVEAPDTLEGGDVVVCGDRIFIGVSRRTTRGGAVALAVAAARLGYLPFLCPVTDRLHLATAVTSVAPGVLIGTQAGFASLDAGRVPDAAAAETGNADAGTADPTGGLRRILLPDAEVAGANVLGIGEVCFLAAGNPTAAAALRREGFRTVEIDLEEFGLGDGGPTCLVNVIP